MKLALLSLAAAPLAALLVTQSAMPQLKAHADKLQAAKTMQLELSVQPIGGATYQATLKVQKPNLFQWDSPERLVTTDGKTIWVYTKATQTYTEDAASATAAQQAFGDEIWVWSAFFDAKFNEAVSTAKAGKSRKLKNFTVKEVDVTFAKRTNASVTVFVDDQLGVARGAMWHAMSDGATKDTLVFADKLTLNGAEMAASDFVFAAPRGATKKEKAAPGILVWKDVEPIFMGNCVGCHGSGGAKAGLRLNTYENAMAGRRGMAIITPGAPDRSSIMNVLNGNGTVMPPSGKMPAETIAKIEKWIADGAKKE